jgi:4-alpha-glucanotransferase
MAFPRSNGILLHPSSFPSRYGIGDLGAGARKFIDFLADGKQHLWQILPLGPTGYGNSPYMCYSALAGNPLLISLDLLQGEGILLPHELEDVPDFPIHRVDYAAVMAWKLPKLSYAAQRFKERAVPSEVEKFEHFCQSQDWLEDYALFMALLNDQDQHLWTDWPTAYRDRQPEALNQARIDFAEAIFFHQFCQFVFDQQWRALKKYASEKGIQIIGDIPIYVSVNSVDVWTNRDLFKLDPQTGLPTEVAGVPPDYFSETGQLWGNPLYDWDALAQQNYQWWIQRFHAILNWVDIVRIDHFRGFSAYWSVPAEEETAINGEWIQGPGAALFEVVRQELGQLPIMAEDLGDIDQSVLDLRDQFDFPGMKILQFAFGGGSGNPYLPFNIERNSVIYTGTHDNDTTLGWYEQAPEYEQQTLQRYLGCQSSEGIAWDMIRLAMSSVANQSIIPLQDVLSLGTTERMNLPGTAEGNWEWRYHEDALWSGHSDRLREMTELYGRERPVPEPEPASNIELSDIELSE